LITPSSNLEIEFDQDWLKVIGRYTIGHPVFDKFCRFDKFSN
ncbi:unnamed protein product, partial [Brachionus calyciflorus]